VEPYAIATMGVGALEAEAENRQAASPHQGWQVKSTAEGGTGFGAVVEQGRIPKSALVCLLIFLLLARLPALLPAVNLSPDATEYIDAARNFASGEGLTLKLRAYFFADGYSIPYPAQSLRSPLFPILMGSIYAVFPFSAVFQIFNLALFAVNMTLLALILATLFPARIAFWSLLLLGMTEPMFLTSIFPWAEQTAFFWLLLSILMASRGIHLRWGIKGALLEGLAAAGAGLSRPEYLLVGAIFCAWHLSRNDRRPAIIGGYLAGFILPLVTVSAINFHLYGRTFLPGDYLFRTRDWAAGPEGIRNMNPSFVLMPENWLWMLSRILRNFVNYLAKLMGWKNLFFLIVAVPAVLRRSILGNYDEGKQLLALVSMSFFAAYCLVFGGMDRERYLIAVTTFMIPLCLLEFDRWRSEGHRLWMRRACLTVMLANLPLFLGNIAQAAIVIHRRPPLGERFYARENPAWSNPDVRSLAVWMRIKVGPDEVVAAENPFLLNYLTGRNTLILPSRVSAENLAQMRRDYRVAYWIDNAVYTTRTAEQSAGFDEALRQSRAQEAGRCGTYRIYRLP
jgi:hypothetical protein